MNTSTPIPGTAIRVEQERNALIEKRASSLKGALDDIEARRCFRVASRTRKAAITARVEVQATVGYRMDAGMTSGEYVRSDDRIYQKQHRPNLYARIDHVYDRSKTLICV